MWRKILSRLVGILADSSVSWLKNLLIRLFVWHYGINLSEALKESIDEYSCFNDFFIRRLKEGVRLIQKGESNFLAPVDGLLYQCGKIEAGQLFNAKGRSFALQELLAGEVKEDFKTFTCFYLSPRDCHRVYLPIAGKLKKMVYVPGVLYSVKPALTDREPSIFSKNERLIVYFDTAWGEMAVIFVGALIVGSIVVPWELKITRHLETFEYTSKNYFFEQGEEIGYFKMGSTVIVLLSKELELKYPINQQVKIGQKLNV